MGRLIRVAWAATGLVILALQLVDIIQFDNRLRHLTNWAFLLHASVCFIKASGLPAIESMVLAWAVSMFVAVGITAITIMDNTMINNFTEEMGSALVWAGNIAMHYVPPLAWLMVMATRKNRSNIRAYLKELESIPVTLMQINTPAVLFILSYSSVFNPSMEYEGDGINYYTVFGSGISAVLLSGAVLLSLP